MSELLNNETIVVITNCLNNYTAFNKTPEVALFNKNKQLTKMKYLKILGKLRYGGYRYATSFSIVCKFLSSGVGTNEY